MMRRWHEDEGGAVAIIVGITMVILVMFAAFVLDIGAVRADVRASQSIADFGATAAVQVLNEGGTFQDACQEVFQYFLANSEDVSTGTMDCSPFALMDSMGCAGAAATIQSADPSAAFMAEGTAGPYTIRVYMPVPDTHFLMTRHGLVTDPDVDGYDQCDRVGVEIFRDRAHLFAGVGGFNDVRSWADAVALKTQDGSDVEYATLILLDPLGCQVLQASGTEVAILVENKPDASEPDGFVDGIITLDSNADECAASPPADYLIKTSGNANRICAGVSSATTTAIFAASPPSTRPACNSTDETLLSPAPLNLVASGPDLDCGVGTEFPCTRVPGGNWPRVEPFPTRGPRVTREPIDHRYNCRGDYYGSVSYADVTGRRQYPISEVVDDRVSACKDAVQNSGVGGGDREDRQPFVDQLISAYGTMSATPAGWTGVSGSACRVRASDPDPMYSGNVFLNCNRFDIDSGATATFNGPGVIVVRGAAGNTAGIQVQGTLRINPSPTGDSILYVQQGHLYNSGSNAVVELYQTFGYFDRGRVSLQGAPLTWTAPDTQAFNSYLPSGAIDVAGACNYTSGPPQPACFQNLAFWGNNFGVHNIGGGGVLNLEGSFFSPNAGRSTNSLFKIHGSTSSYRLDKAQFFSYQLEVVGGAGLSMAPDKNRINPTPLKGGGLIR